MLQVTAIDKFAKTLQTVSSSWDLCHVQVAHLNQKAPWAAVADSGRKSESKAVLEEIYKLTQEECAKGWMRGPCKLGGTYLETLPCPLVSV